MTSSMVGFLNQLREARGTAVLDLPFCVVAGSGTCNWQCQGYPGSTAGACFRGWHEKDVYGLYASRLLDAQCGIFARFPFDSWMQAWAQRRCFNEEDWKGLCNHLKEHPELAAVLVYPEMWWGEGKPECLEDFKTHLGQPIAQSEFYMGSYLGGVGHTPTRVFWFSPECREGK